MSGFYRWLDLCGHLVVGCPRHRLLVFTEAPAGLGVGVSQKLVEPGPSPVRPERRYPALLAFGAEREDNQAPAAVAGVDDGEASVLLMAPGIEAVPERMPKLTLGRLHQAGQ